MNVFVVSYTDVMFDCSMDADVFYFYTALGVCLRTELSSANRVLSIRVSLTVK